MSSRSVAVALLAAGCVTAAAGGSYLAVRQNAPATAQQQAPTPAAPAVTPATPVTETEGVITPQAPSQIPAAPERVEPPPAEPPVGPPPAARRRAPAVTQRASAAPAVTPEEPSVARTARVEAPPIAADTPATLPEPERRSPESASAPSEPLPSRSAEPTFDEIVIPSSAVIGLEIERTVTSEQARLEDRVDARVTRDVYVGGRLAVPAGSRVTGNVTLVERGGKMKDRARLGVRFHTLVLADGRLVPIRTETVLREGDSPAGESSRKIGGAAIGGAVLGALLGGGKGAVAGAAAGAAGGTAAVMAGGRQAAILAGGSVVTVRLSAPASVEIER